MDEYVEYLTQTVIWRTFRSVICTCICMYALHKIEANWPTFQTRGRKGFICIRIIATFKCMRNQLHFWDM